MAFADFMNSLLPQDPDQRDAAIQGLLTTGLSMIRQSGTYSPIPVGTGRVVGQAGLEGMNQYQNTLRDRQEAKLRQAILASHLLDYQAKRQSLENQQNVLDYNRGVVGQLQDYVNQPRAIETLPAYNERLGISGTPAASDAGISTLSPEGQSMVSGYKAENPMKTSSLAQLYPELSYNIGRMAVDPNAKLPNLSPKPNLVGVPAGGLYNYD